MRFIISLIFLVFPIILFVLLSTNNTGKIIRHFKKKKYLITLLLFIVFVVSSPILFSPNSIILLNIFEHTQSYKDLEMLNVAIIADSILAIVFGLAVRNKKVKLDSTRISLTFVILAIIIIETLSSFSCAFYANKNVTISEVCRKQITEYLDENDEESKDEESYVTLYNPNEYASYFDKLYISTDEDWLAEHRFTDILIPANGTYTLYFEYGDLDISKSKESDIFLSCDKYDEYIDYVRIPVLENDFAYSLNLEDDSWNVI